MRIPVTANTVDSSTVPKLVVRCEVGLELLVGRLERRLITARTDNALLDSTLFMAYSPSFHIQAYDRAHGPWVVVVLC